MCRLLIALLLLTTAANAQTVKLHHAYYDLTYDTVEHHPVYGHYFFTAKNFGAKLTTAQFSFDNMLSVVYQHGNREYTHTHTYDKGHIVPHDDFCFDTLANRQVNVYTNCAPQIIALNRGLWASIEKYVRKQAAVNAAVEVWTGVIYGKDKFTPLRFWKVLRYGKTVDAFMVLNKKPVSASITKARCRVKDIERITGLNF